MNLFDGAIVMISWVEVIFLGDGEQATFSVFRSVRIFRVFRTLRTFRVLRVTKLLRALDYLQVIIDVVSRTISSFIYIAFLLLLFILIYSLLGMELFGAKFNFPNNPYR